MPNSAQLRPRTSSRGQPSQFTKASFARTNLPSLTRRMPMKIGLAWNAALKRASLSRNRASLARNSASACFRSVMSNRHGKHMRHAVELDDFGRIASIVHCLPVRFRKRHSRSRMEPVRRNSAQNASRSSWRSHTASSVEFRPRISSRRVARPNSRTHRSPAQTAHRSCARWQ